MSIFIGKLGGEEGLHQLLGELHPDDAGAENQYVHVVVLDALMRGVGVVAYRRANACQFIGRYACPYTAAADQHTPFSFAVEYGLAYGLREVRIIGRIFIERPD